MQTAAAPLRRFYKEAEAAPLEGGGFAVLLDGRTLRTPGKNALAAPTRALAEAIAAEWAAQGETIEPMTMPLTRLVNVALDLAPGAAGPLADEVAKYAATDLVCHRADAPASLAERQAAAWDPLLAWAEAALDLRLFRTIGVIAASQPEDAAGRLRALAAGLDPFRLTGLAHGTGLAGSAVIAFALARGRLGGREAFEAAFLDDLFQLERWGEDAEARARLDRLAEDFAALERWFRLLD